MLLLQRLTDVWQQVMLLPWLTCYNMAEKHLPEGLVLASEKLEEEGVQLCCCQLQHRASFSGCAVL